MKKLLSLLLISSLNAATPIEMHTFNMPHDERFETLNHKVNVLQHDVNDLKKPWYKKKKSIVRVLGYAATIGIVYTLYNALDEKIEAKAQPTQTNAPTSPPTTLGQLIPAHAGLFPLSDCFYRAGKYMGYTEYPKVYVKNIVSLEYKTNDASGSFIITTFKNATCTFLTQKASTDFKTRYAAVCCNMAPKDILMNNTVQLTTTTNDFTGRIVSEYETYDCTITPVQMSFCIKVK